MKDFFILTRRHILISIFVLLLAIVLVGAGAWNRAYHEKFFPGVFLGGAEVGGQRFDDVLARVRLVAESLKTTGLTVVVPVQEATSTIVIPMRSSGLTPDVVVEYFSIGDYETAVREAFAYGRGGGLGERIVNRFRAFMHGFSVAFPVVVRDTAIQSLFDRELALMLRQPVDARVVIVGGRVVLTEGTAGEQVAIAPVIAGVHAMLSGLTTNRLKLAVAEAAPRVTLAALQKIEDFVRRVAAGPGIVLEYRTKVVSVPGSTLATWLTVGGSSQVEIAVRDELIADFIRRTINEHIDDRPQNSRFAMRDGVLVEILPGTAGSVAEIAQLAGSIENELNTQYLRMLFNDRVVQAAGERPRFPVSFTTAPPLITKETIAAYRINELIGSATTSYKGSTASRKHNIAIGAERVSGVLIAPGEEFSLVRALGEVSEEVGYEKEYVIKGDRSVKEAGGGLCQIATTVFRAALAAGLPITERTNHSYVVGYYGPGLDATIYGPWPDLKFVNDTGQYMLFQMRTQGDALVAEFYGKRDGREVTVGTPVFSEYIDPPPPKYIPAVDKPWGAMECTDQPRRGLTAEVGYAVKYPDGRLEEQIFKSVYQPWPKICLVGIKTP